MQKEGEQLTTDVRRVAHDIESIMKEKANGVADRAGDAARMARAEVERARERVTRIGKQVNRDIKRRVQATDRLVRSNPWRTAGLAAAAGLVIGLIAGRRH